MHFFYYFIGYDNIQNYSLGINGKQGYLVFLSALLSALLSYNEGTMFCTRLFICTYQYTEITVIGDTVFFCKTVSPAYK